MRDKERTGPAKTIDAYLANVPGESRAALEKIRRTIKTVAPDATESISWGMPAFKYRGMLVGFAAFKDHCSFFPMSVALMELHKNELRGYDTSKGTIRFSPDKPISATLVKKFVKERMKENEVKSNRRMLRK